MSDSVAVCTLDDTQMADEMRPADISIFYDDDLLDSFETKKPLTTTHADASSTLDVHSLDASSDWFQDALRALEAMKDLPEDWDASGAEPPNEIAIRNSRMILAELDKANVKPSFVEPSTDDAVCIGFWAGNRYADIECFNNGEILAMIHERGNSEPEIWDYDPKYYTPTMERIQRFLNE